MVPEEGVQDQVLDDERLDPQQREAVQAVLRGQNVFITGGAGVGKTWTIAAVVEALRSKYVAGFQDKVAVTAATGTAALLAGGMSLHSLAGTKVPKEVKDFKMDKIHREIWQQLEVLLVDEVSMISGEFFDLLENEVRRVREDGRAFGGLQVILVGDLFQLPPVPGRVPAKLEFELDPDHLRNNRAVVRAGPRGKQREYFLNRGMVFQSDAFWELDLRYVELSTPHRQRGDDSYAEILRCLRKGLSADHIEDLNECCYRPLEELPDEATVLSPTIAKVNEINSQRLSELPGEARVFKAEDSVDVTAEPPANETYEEQEAWKAERRRFLEESQFFTDNNSACPANSKLSLKVGALVMLSHNVDQQRGLVNGRMGHVVKLGQAGVLVDFRGLDRPQFIKYHTFESQIPGIGKCIRKQCPLRLAWAITHHRSQGKTLTRVLVDPESFTSGQTYVALSRSEDMSGLRLLRPLRERHFRPNFQSIRFESILFTNHRAKLSTWRQLPVVFEGGRRASVQAAAKADASRQAARAAAVTAAPTGGTNDRFTSGKYFNRTFAEAANDAKYCKYILQRTIGTTLPDSLAPFKLYLEQRRSIAKGP